MIFDTAYDLMNQSVIDGNCGELCGYHCCRSHEGQEDLGMYLLPLEYEHVQKHLEVAYEHHTSNEYELVSSVDELFYIFCSNDSGCLRDNRPIQCRTYPLEPHYRYGELSLVIEKDQLHTCPLISRVDDFREEFVEGVYKAWHLLLKIPKIKAYIHELSVIRETEANIMTVVKS